MDKKTTKKYNTNQLSYPSNYKQVHRKITWQQSNGFLFTLITLSDHISNYFCKKRFRQHSGTKEVCLDCLVQTNPQTKRCLNLIHKAFPRVSYHLQQAHMFHFPLHCLTVSPWNFSTKDGSVLQNGCHYKDHLLQVLNTKTNTKQLGMETGRLGPKTLMEPKSSGWVLPNLQQNPVMALTNQPNPILVFWLPDIPHYKEIKS